MIGIIKAPRSDQAISTTIEYILISSILLVFLMITTLTLPYVLVERPTDQLRYHAFLDIGNGVSTRIVDFYTLIPLHNDCTIVNSFSIPDEVAGSDYSIQVKQGNTDQIITIYKSSIKTEISLAGIGKSSSGTVSHSTTGGGMKTISYQFP